jgi:hypothetical protein
MNSILNLSRIWRRWYIIIPGMILAIGLAIATWQLVPIKYERTATQLLLPGTRSLPEKANPYYYLGGLSQAADVLVTAVGSENVLSEIERDFPGTTVEVTRDVTTSAPVVAIKVTARTDSQAGQVLSLMVERTAAELESLQDANRAARADRITVVPVTVDQQSTERPRDKLVATVAVGGSSIALTILIAALVEGLSSRDSEVRSSRASRSRISASRRRRQPGPSKRVFASTRKFGALRRRTGTSRGRQIPSKTQLPDARQSVSIRAERDEHSPGASE